MKGRRWEEGKARQDMLNFFSAKGWCFAASQCNEPLEKLPLRALRERNQHYSSQARFGLNGEKRGKMQRETGRREGQVQRERDSQSTEFLQALSDPHNQQGSIWQQGI